MTLANPTPAAWPTTACRFDNGQEWLDSLGGVPLDRVIFDPWPGSATETHLLEFVERDKRLCELVNNTLVEKPVGLSEGNIAGRVLSRIIVYADDHDLGVASGADSTLRMATFNRIRLPDVCFFSKERLPGGKLPRGGRAGARARSRRRDVLSESNTKSEMQQKLIEYFDNGTRLAWYVDPRTRTVAVYDAPGEPKIVLNQGDDTLDGGDVLPGFSLKISTIFKDLPSDE